MAGWGVEVTYLKIVKVEKHCSKLSIRIQERKAALEMKLTSLGMGDELETQDSLTTEID